MAQNDIQITTTPPLSGLTLVENVNDAFQSLATDFAGAIDPASLQGVGPYATWADTANGLLKRRNAAGTAWVVEGKLMANNFAAENIDYDNSGSGLASENVQTAIDELAGEKLDADKNIVLGTAVAATGTAVDFTGIPSTAKRITVMFRDVSTNGSDYLLLRLGTASGIESGAVYYSMSGANTTANTASAVNYTTGMGIQSGNAGNALIGKFVIDKVLGNIWIANGIFASNTGTILHSVSRVSLAGVLTQLRITTTGGVNAFDAGNINISWE